MGTQSLIVFRALGGVPGIFGMYAGCHTKLHCVGLSLACERRPISGGDKRQPEIGLRSQARLSPCTKHFRWVGERRNSRGQASKIPFLGFSLLLNPTETLATQDFIDRFPQIQREL